MPLLLQISIVFIVVLWLSWITYLLLKLKKTYDNFLIETNKRQLSEALDAILASQKEEKKHIAELMSRCDRIEKDSAFHIQKVGLLRFNPFNDTGGDQSFILALVDSQSSGVVISGLYSRSGTRWYAKRVLKGEGTEHELSKEEKKALTIATNR
jgi:hypothetical protein